MKTRDESAEGDDSLERGSRGEGWVTTGRALGIVFLLWAFTYLPGLGTGELKGEEGRRILPARAMLESGDFVQPVIGGKPYNRKPPLINWAVAGSFKVTGIQNEWTARAPSALFVLVLGIGVACAGGSLARSPLAGLLAAVFLLTSIALVEKGRLAEIEPLYVACTGLAFATWSAGWVDRKNPWVTWFLPGVFLGLGMLAKGPVHLLFFYVPVCCCLALEKDWSPLWKRAHLVGLVPLLLPVTLWGALLSGRAESASLGEAGNAGDVWLDQLIGRIAPENFSVVSWLFTPFEVLLNFAPWVLLLAVFLTRLYYVRRNAAPLSTFTAPDDPVRLRIWVRGTAWGTAATALFIALLPQSEARYAHPALPAASLLLALAVFRLRPDVAADRQVIHSWRIINRVLLWLAGAVLFCLPPVTLFAVSWNFGSAAWFALGCLDCVLLIALGILAARHPWPGTQSVASCCVVCTLAILYASAVLPAVKPEDDVRPIARTVEAALPEGNRLCVLNPGIRPFLFYLTPGYTEVVRSTEIPEGTTHILAPRRVYEEKLELPGFRALAPEPVLEFEDKRREDFVLARLGKATTE